MTDYVLALVHEDDRVFGISFPDFPGCVSGGKSLAEAIEKGQAALAFHVEGMLADGEDLRAIRSRDGMKSDPEFRAAAKGAIVAAVPLDLPGKAVRVNVSLDERLLERIDRAAQSAQLSRSGFLARAARREIAG